MMERATESCCRPKQLVQTRPVGSTWLVVGVAAFAMVATLPGRTHGLGLVTEPLLRDLGIDRVQYASINLWATLFGAIFCVPWGWLIDRLGAAAMLALTLMALGAVVVVMGQVPGTWIVTWAMPAPSWLSASGTWNTTLAMDLFLLVLLTRGLGQSALSVVSITMLGQSTGARSGLAVGIYSFLVAVGFAAAFSLIKYVDDSWRPGWRELWSAIGWVVLASGPVAWILIRPLRLRETTPGHGDALPEASSDMSVTFGEALRSPAFWVFGIATSLYGLIAAGISLFNESILAERGFDRGVYLAITSEMFMVGLASNLASGWLATRWPMGRILALAMFLLASALLSYPFVASLTHLYLYAVVMAVAGGMVTVIFFSVWARAFGKKHLGQIQGAAQMITVLASAFGPLLLAFSKERTQAPAPVLAASAVGVLGAPAGAGALLAASGVSAAKAVGSYVPIFRIIAVVAGLLCLAVLAVRMPNRQPRSSVGQSTPHDAATPVTSKLKELLT
jgi:MFS family permease